MSIRIGFDHPFQPFAYLKDGVPHGSLIDLVAQVMTRAALPFEWAPMTLEQTEPALYSGDVDALAFKGIIPERAALMDFSDTLVVSGAALFRAKGLRNSDDPKDFPRLRAATPRKGPLAAQFARNYPDIDLVLVDSYESAFEALVAAKVSLAALNFHAGIQIANDLLPGLVNLPTAPYAPLPLAFAVAKGRHAELIEEFNIALRSIGTEGT
ncbi:MAG: substrate-binding periplasmic protein [Burkholderiales bacterium]